MLPNRGVNGFVFEQCEQPHLLHRHVGGRHFPSVHQREECSRPLLAAEQSFPRLRLERDRHRGVCFHDGVASVYSANASQNGQGAFLHLRIGRRETRLNDGDASGVAEFFERRETFHEKLSRCIRVGDIGVNPLTDIGDFGSEREAGDERTRRCLPPRGPDQVDQILHHRLVLPCGFGWHRAGCGEVVEQPPLPNRRPPHRALGESAVEVFKEWLLLDRRPVRDQSVSHVVADRGALGGVAPDEPAQVRLEQHTVTVVRQSSVLIPRGEERDQLLAIRDRLALDGPPQEPRNDRIGRIDVAQQESLDDGKRLLAGEALRGAEELRPYDWARVIRRELRELPGVRCGHFLLIPQQPHGPRPHELGRMLQHLGREVVIQPAGNM